MKIYIFILIFVCVCQPWPAASSHGMAVDDVIGNVNNQLRMGATAKVVMKITDGKEIIETKSFDLLMKVSGGEEIIKGKIFEPANRRGMLTITWSGGRASIKHTETGHGKERKISARLKNSFLGSGISYVEIRALEDTENYEYSWLSENTIKAISKNIGMTVYWKRILTVEKKGDGLWVINHIKYYDGKDRLVKVRENKDFKVYEGWRPREIVVKKEKSAYTTNMEMDWESPTVFD
jgi:hypothetical protein